MPNCTIWDPMRSLRTVEHRAMAFHAKSRVGGAEGGQRGWRGEGGGRAMAQTPYRRESGVAMRRYVAASSGSYFLVSKFM